MKVNRGGKERKRRYYCHQSSSIVSKMAERCSSTASFSRAPVYALTQLSLSHLSIKDDHQSEHSTKDGTRSSVYQWVTGKACATKPFPLTDFKNNCSNVVSPMGRICSCGNHQII